MASYFCDHQNSYGELCNNPPEYELTRFDGVKMTLCNRCLFKEYDSESDDEVVLVPFGSS